MGSCLPGVLQQPVRSHEKGEGIEVGARENVAS